MHTKARLFLGVWLVAGLASIGPAHAQIPTDLAVELDRMLAQVADAPADRNPAERARRLEMLGDVEVRASMLSAARSAYEEASALRERNAPDDRDLGRLTFKLAGVARLDKRQADADRLVDLAVARLRTGAPLSQEYADALMESARGATARNDAAKAEATYKEALEVVSKLQPGSAREAQIVEQLGDYAVRRNELEAADGYYARALAVLEPSQRNTIDYARVSNALAVVAAQRGQATRAQQLYETSLRIYESQRPDSLEVSQLLNNLGILEMNRGEMAAAEARFRRALTIKTAKKGLPEDVGTTHANLGLALFDQGKLEESAAEFKLAVDLRRAQAPPLELAALLVNLARADRLLGKLDQATTSARESLDLRRAQAPQSLLVAASATELALSRESAKAYAEALALNREALDIREKLSPGTVDVAQSLERIAVITAASGDTLSARSAFERAVDAWARVSPGSLDHVNVVHELGEVLVQRGEAEEGLRRLREAVDLLDKSPAQPAGTADARLQLVSRLQAYYGAPMRILADRGDAGEAFTLLDRMHEKLRRARCETCPPLTSMSPIEALRRGVEDGTLVIAFSVQPAAAYAFVGRRDAPIRAYRIDETASALSERVEQFNSNVRERAAATTFESPVVSSGRAIFNLLFGQFEGDASRADRLLIIPDGPLELLPFSAVARPQGRVSWQYMVDWKPMIFAPSLSQAVAWGNGSAAPASASQLFPTTPAPEAVKPKLVGEALTSGALVSLWTPAEKTTDDLTELFATSITTTRPREAALMRAQKVLRDERGRTHPVYWAAFRYYGARGAR